MERKITTIGTVQANRKGIPSEIKQVYNRDNGSYKVFWNEPEKIINLNSFIVNSTTTGKQNILILSTMQPIFGISKDQKSNQLYTNYVIIRKEVQTLLSKKLVSICAKPSLENGPELHFCVCLTLVA